MKSKFQLDSELLRIAEAAGRKGSRLPAIVAAIIFAAMQPVSAQQLGPTVKIADVRMDGVLTVHYSIENHSAVPLLIYSPFLRRPLAGLFDRKSGFDTIWLTFPPEQKGNVEQSLDTIEIPAGSSYSGDFPAPEISDQIRDCGKGEPVSLRLAIGWSREPLRDHKSKTLGFVDAIAEVDSWQTVAKSNLVMVRLPRKKRRKICVAVPLEEWWR
jgi:hypothetical protein